MEGVGIAVDMRDMLGLQYIIYVEWLLFCRRSLVCYVQSVVC